ncbi:MAG: nucleotidyltransferase [Nocardioidaceae bacterium]
MARTVNSAFASFDEELNLDPRERDKAQRRHNDISDLLRAAGVIEASFLQGSFARKTMLKPLKDVDIVMLLDKGKYGHLRSDMDGPREAMELFKGPVKRQWPAVKFDAGEKPAGKALRLAFPDCEFTVDLVAALPTDTESVLIGNRDERRWEPSNTRKQIRLVRDRNTVTGGRFVHQVRMVKAFRKHHELRLEFIKGIVIESLAFDAIHLQLADKKAVSAVLWHAAEAVTGPVLDPAGDDDVTAKWTSQQREVAVATFADQAQRAEEALRLEAHGDTEGAIDAWQAVLGKDFPDAQRRTAKESAGAWAIGSMSRAGRPSTTRAADQQLPAGRSWSSH